MQREDTVGQIQKLGKSSRNGCAEMNTDGIPWVIEYLWVPLWAAVLWLFRKAFGTDTRVAVLEEAMKTQKQIQKETLDTLKGHSSDLGSHNTAVLSAVERLSDQVRGNGHRIGSIEEHLRKDGN